MKVGWTQKPFDDCLTGFPVATKVQRKDYLDDGRFPIVSQEAGLISGYWNDASDVNKLARPVVIFGDHTQVVKFIDFDFVIGADGVKVLNPREFIDPKFFYYFICANPLPSLGYARHYRHLRELTVPYPSLEEQKRIVAVLDEAFEGLSHARTNAEANLKDARELFESYRARAMAADDGSWKRCKVEDSYLRVSVPAKVPRKEYLDSGRFPIVSQESDLVSGYWNKPSDAIKVERPLVVFGDHTRHVKYVDFDFVVGADGTQIMVPLPEIHPRFYFYALQSIRLEGKGYARHFSILKKCEFSYPRNLEAQQRIAESLDEVERESAALGVAYSCKLQELSLLRQSLLQNAFSGELT